MRGKGARLLAARGPGRKRYCAAPGPLPAAFAFRRCVTYVTPVPAAPRQDSRAPAGRHHPRRDRPMTAPEPLALLAVLAGLQVKHLLFDFVFQGDWQLRNKGRYGHPGGLAHAGLHGLGTLGVLLPAGLVLPVGAALALALAALEAVVHYHIDWIKAQVSARLGLTPDRPGYWAAMGLDQAAHQLTYLGLAAILVLRG